MDDTDGSDTGGPFGVPRFPADETDSLGAGSPYVLGYRSGLTESTGSAEDASERAFWHAASTSSWFADRAYTETATETPPQPAPPALEGTDPPQSLSAGYLPGTLTGDVPGGMPGDVPGDVPGEMGTISDMHQQTPSSSSSSSWSSFSAPAAPAPPPPAHGYAGSAARTWQSRITTAERRPRTAGHGARQAHLTLARVEPWSVLKFSFVASVVAFVILFVAVIVLYGILAGMGVFDSLQSTASSITSSQNTAGTDISGWFSASTIFGYTGMLGALNIVLIPALCTVGAIIYNLIAEFFGGVEVTLRE